MGLSHSLLIKKYKENKNPNAGARGSSLYFDGDTLHSSFLGELAVKGKWGAGVKYIINGDRFNFIAHNLVATGSLRSPDKNDVVQIPFSALAGPGIVKSTKGMVGGFFSEGLDRSIRIVDTRDDRYWEVCAVCGKPVFKMPYGERLQTWEERQSAHKEAGVVTDYFYDQPVHWKAPGELVEITGTYRFKWVHIKDKTSLCTNDSYPLGEKRTEHELGATVIRWGRRYFLSSVDYDEPRRNYFLCELPKKVKNINEAYEALMPLQVAYAGAIGRKVIRQGEIFAIKSDIPTRDLNRPSRKWDQLFGSTHVATEVRSHLGRIYARGTLRHRPYLITPGRAPEHVMRMLGKDWWEIYKNTARGSWQITGRVD